MQGARLLELVLDHHLGAGDLVAGSVAACTAILAGLRLPSVGVRAWNRAKLVRSRLFLLLVVLCRRVIVLIMIVGFRENLGRAGRLVGHDVVVVLAVGQGSCHIASETLELLLVLGLGAPGEGGRLRVLGPLLLVSLGV